MRTKHIPKIIRLWMYLFGFAVGLLTMLFAVVISTFAWNIGLYFIGALGLGSWTLWIVLTYLKKTELQHWGLVELEKN